MKKTSAKESSSPTNPEHDEILKKIGINIRRLRRQQNRNYFHWSDEHKISRSLLLRLENGENCTFRTLLTILDELNVSIKEFFKEI
jgi:transcriptional regulator with XRE-family HTH domain